MRGIDEQPPCARPLSPTADQAGTRSRAARGLWWCRAKFRTEQDAQRVETYLKAGSGRAFAWRHLAPSAGRAPTVDGPIDR